MKNSLSDIYEQILLNEAEKHALQNPSSDEVGNLKIKNDLFGTKPKPVEGPDKAKLAKGPSYKETTGLSSSKASSDSKSSAPMKSAPTKNPTTEKPKEMKDTDVDPTNEDEKDNKKKKEETKKESFALSSFEALFKKALIEENEEEAEEESEEGSVKEESLEGEGDFEFSGDEETEEIGEEEEGDLLSDLKELQTKLSDILAKLEDSSDEEGEEESEDYTEGDFDEEFGETSTETGDETAMKESVDKPKVLSPAKGKTLMSKKNKIGKVNPKGGKAHTGTVDDAPKPKPLGDKKGTLQKGKPEVRSNIKKGDFIK